MALTVNDELSEIGDVTGKVIIDSSLGPDQGTEAYSELGGPDCRRLALMYAASRGLHSPGVNGNPSVYPIGEDGKEIVNPSGKIRGFQAEVPVTRRIV